MKKRRIISMLLVFAIVCCNVFFGKGVEIKANYFTYYNTNVSQTVNGVEWTVYGTLAYDDEKREWFLTNITSVNASIDKNANISEIIVPESISDGQTKAEITKLKGSAFKDNTKIESVVLNSKITEIGNSCFSGCTNLKSVTAVNNANAIWIGSEAFYGCTSLEKVDIILEDVGMNSFTECAKLEKITIGGVDERIIQNFAFSGTGLSEINFSEKITKLTLGASCFANTALTNVTIPCECEMSQGVFKNCIKLQKLEFKGKVTRKELHQMYGEAGMYGAFENAFGIEYDNRGNLIEKEVIFHDTAVFQQYEKISSRTRGEFASCSGLTKVTFEKEATIPRWTFYNCTNLEKVNFNAQTGIIRLGASCFLGCKLKDLYFYTNLYCQKDDLLEGAQASPFYKSNLVNLYITPDEKERCSVNISASTLENVYFGENVDCIDGSIHNCPNVKKIVIENPYLDPRERTASDYGDSGRNLLNDTLTQRHHIIGYSSSDVTLQNVEEWTEKYSTNGIFSNIIQKDTIKVSELKYIGSVKKENIDFTKLNVTYSKYDDVRNEVQVKPSTDGTDIGGYVLETKNLPETLEADEDGENREYIYTVVLAGEKVFAKIIVEPKKITGMKVDWNENNIQNLVSNQPITISDIVSGASVTYNDGEEKSISLTELNLKNTKTVENKNTFTVALKSDTNVGDFYTADIPKNYVTSIEVDYTGENLYVGESIDISKVRVYPHYKYDLDPELERKVEATKILNTEITNEGANTVEVFYGDICATLTVNATKVVPTSITAYFDSDNCKYIEGQKEIDKTSIKAKVSYNDGTCKEIDGSVLDSIEIVSKLSTEIGVKVKYQNIESPVFFIPVTPKQVKEIKVTSSIKSAVEGTTLPKSMVSAIDVTYDNGITETLTKENIEYDKLLLKNTEIKANTENNITVEYLGKIDTVTIIGIPNTIKGISAVYTGAGVPVGNVVTLDEIKVTASNTNGVETEIKNGCLLENAMIYNVGVNKVIVHYGEFQCDLEVKGIAAVLVPTATVEATNVPGANTAIEPTIMPTMTSGSSVTSTPIVTPTTLPNIEATNAPVEVPSNELPSENVTVTKSVVTFTSSVKSIKVAKKKTYKIVTNKKVLFTCKVQNATDLKYQFVKKGASIKTNKWKAVKKNKITIADTANKSGILYISYKDYAGKTKKIYTNGFKIDKKKATINVKNNQTYKKGQKLTFNDVSGIKSAKLDGKSIKTGKKVTQKGKHTLVVVDKAGNKAKISFMIK